MPAKRRLSRWAAFSCVHVPHHDPKAIERAIAALPRGLTDLVCLGDLFDAAAASVHAGDETDHTLADEYEAAAAILEQFRCAVPRTCTLWWCLGNHDDNLRTRDARRIPRELRSLVDWNQSPWGDVFRKWKQIPYRAPSRHSTTGCVQLGQVILFHGCTTNEWREAREVWWATDWHPHRLIVRGHTHRPTPVQQYNRTDGVLPIWTANAGTLIGLNPPPQYMMRKNTNSWGPAIVHGECKVDTPSRFAGKSWDAETILL